MTYRSTRFTLPRTCSGDATGHPYIQQIFKDNLLAHYEALLGNVQADYNVPIDLYTAIIDAMDFGEENLTIQLHSPELLYLFEFYICTKNMWHLQPLHLPRMDRHSNTANHHEPPHRERTKLPLHRRLKSMGLAHIILL